MPLKSMQDIMILVPSQCQVVTAKFKAGRDLPLNLLGKGVSVIVNSLNRKLINFRKIRNGAKFFIFENRVSTCLSLNWCPTVLPTMDGERVSRIEIGCCNSYLISLVNFVLCAWNR